MSSLGAYAKLGARLLKPTARVPLSVERPFASETDVDLADHERRCC